MCKRDIDPYRALCCMASGELVEQILAEAGVRNAKSEYTNKRVRQLLDSYLEHGTRIAPEGTLAYTLYTIVPNPGRSLMSSWEEAEREMISLKVALESCGDCGVVAAFLNIETHPPFSKKKSKKKARVTQQQLAQQYQQAGQRHAPEPHEVLLDGAEELEDEVVPAPVQGAPLERAQDAEESQKIDSQALKPHFHIVLLHDTTAWGLKDPGYLNRLLASKDLRASEAGGAPPRFQVSSPSGAMGSEVEYGTPERLWDRACWGEDSGLTFFRTSRRSRFPSRSMGRPTRYAISSKRVETSSPCVSWANGARPGRGH